MLKLSQKKRKALLALAVAAAVIGANNAFAASVHDKAITESNQYGSAVRTYWKEAGVYNAKTHTYTFNEDVTLKPNASDQDFNHWTPMFGGIYIAGNKPVTIDMQGHRLDLALNVDQPKGVNNVRAVSPNAIHVSSADLVINNVKGMELSAKGSFLSAGKLRGIYVAGTNQEGAYGDGKGLASLTINNADGWENAVKFHSSQPQVENAIEVWKNTGSADLKISGMVDLYVGNDSDVITVRGGNSSYDIDKVPTAYIGGGAIKAAMGRAAVVSGGELSINSKLQDGAVVAAEGSRDVQVEGNILVKDQQKDQGILTLGMNTDKSYFKGTIFNDNGAGEVYMLLANGAQWTNESKGDYNYHNSSLNQLVGGEADAKAGNIFQKDSGSLTIDKYSGNTNIFYAHTGNGEAAENYAAGNTVIKGAAAGSVVSMITDNTGVAMDNKDSVANVLNALAGKLTYSNYVNGENNLTGYVKIADGLTASSAALKTGDISFNKEDGKGSYNAQAPVVPEAKTEFTTTLTGDKATDTEYADANIIADDGTYKFAKDSTITTTDKHGADIKQAATINAEGKTLTFNTNVTGSSTVYALGASSADGVTVNADKLVINGSSTSGRVEGINVGQGAQSKDKPMKLTINGDTEFNMKGIGYTLGLYANGNSEVTFNGNVTAMGNENSEWGLTSEEGAYGYYGCSLVYSGSNYSLQMGPKVTINGDVNAKIDGNALFANGGHAKLTINGGGNIEINKDNEHNYYAMMAESGTTSMNVNLDENYDAVSARDNKLVLKGNVGASTGAMNPNEPELYTKVNLGLATADSEWTGVAHNGFKDEGNKSGSKTFYGAINVFLQNGATWNNEEWGETATPWDGTGFEGSHVAKFVGGVSDAKAGNIFQNDSNNLTIDNYSGNTNIFYAHTGNGEAAENYAAGDTVIKGAAAGSVVSMITDNTGVAMDNKDSVANVLNALAGKLTYSNYVNGESNLTGYVKIADGLTASSAALKTGNITFSKEDGGKGSYPTETPVVPPKTEFTTALTGDAATDTEYVGNIQDGKYVFGANTTINAAAKNAVEVKAPLTIDAGNNQLVLMAKQGDYISAVPLFKQAVEGTTSIKADKLVIKNCTNDFKERSGMEVTKGNVDINADVDMKLSAASNAYGIYVKANGSSVAIHGDLNLADSEQYDSINGLYVENAVDFGAKTSAITVDGKADINLRNGNAITAIRNGSTVSVGGGNIKIAKNNSKEFYALQSDGGVVNVNMNADKNAAGTATTVIEGNISAYGEKANKAFDMDVTDSIINIGLADKQSSWTGTAFAKDLGTSGFPFKGIVNLYLANGATWNNEAWGKTNAAFEGSHVTKFAGGASEAAAGNIFQKDSNNLTIDNYSGNTNIFYAHTGNGENASNYAAGDTIIKSAAAGSAVSLITDNTGISMDNDASVANVLNTLAGKLTYSNFVNGENNLNGSVKIAAGLTASDKIMKVDTIKFNKDTGKGYTKEETVNPGGGEKTTFTDAITGEKQGVFSAVQQEDLSYVFAEDASININQMTHKEKDPDWEGSFIISGAAVQNAAGVENLVIKAADKTLKLNVALDSKTVPPDKNAGILNNRIPLRGIDNSIAGSTTSITAGTLDINIDNTYSRKTSSGNPLIGEGSAIGIYAKSAGEKAVVEVTGNTAIKAHGYNNVYGVNANGNAEIKLHGDLTMAKDGEEWALDNVIKGQNTTTLGESSWRNIAGINANGAGASVTVDGKTTIAAHGSGVVAADGATVNLGAADIEIKNNSNEDGYGFHALGAALGTVNVGSEGKTVTVKGNAGLFGKQGQKFASDSKESVINLKLTTEDSAWTGVAYKHFDAEKDAGLSGSMNLTLANGASWNNEKYGYVYGDSEWEKYKFTGSEIANFVGGASEAKAGNIFQKDANSLTIDNYSGNTNIFYAHTGNGEAADNYAAGDTVIKHAAAGSVVSMITDNTGIAMDNQASVNNVLNALAGKLTYSNFVNGEKNLTGFVKIADGLTASSAALKTGDITFNEADGKGGFVSAPVIPDHQVTTSFTTTLTGDKEQDEEYLLGGVIAADGTYKFTETSDITAVSAINTAKDLKIDATGKTLTVNTAGTDSAAIKILNDGGSKVDINADKLVIKSSSEYAGKNSGIYAGDWNTTRKNVNITADVDITSTNTVGNNNYVYGVLASKADITVNGNLKANIDGGKGGYDHTSVSALIAQGSSYRKYASTITVNGDVDITANGNGLHANNNGAVVTVNGGGAITINDSSAKGGYAALRAGNGTVNMNVALENGKATGGLGKDVAIKGNLAAVKAGDQTASVINLALDTAKSSLEGVSYMTEGNGQINLWLQNGASWTNEVHGSAEKDWKGNSLFNGSHVTNFAGGASDAKAGNIFQKDANSLTIDNYSGITNIFYAHTGNGEAAENYAAGDTVIKHAAEGSVVSMITDNSGIAMDNAYSVANVLNALAGKLTYSNFVNGEKNLTGYVKIADGLTASSKAMQTGDISFSAEDGKGSLKVGSLKPGFTYPETQKPGSNVINQGITGNAKDDYQLKMDGILKEDGSYVFTQDPTKIEVKEGAAVGATDKDIVIDTTKAKLELKGADAGINADGANVNIKGNTNISGATGINAESGNVTLTGSTVINGTDAAINAGAGANVTVDGNNSALTINGSINADGGNITVDSGKATGTITGNINAANGGSVAINLTEKNSALNGGYNVDGTSSIEMNLANGATWHLTDGEEAAGMSLLRMAKGVTTPGLTINGGKTEAEKGFLDMTERTKTLDIAHYSGWETVIYDHEGKGDKVEDYKSGDTVIAKADKGSGVILSTDGSGITMTDKKAVEATLKALAQKVTYKDHAANGENLSGKVQIAEGLTSSSVSKNLGTIHWDENGKGQYDLDSVDWNKIIEGDYETFVMKGVRSAATTSLHTWRDNMQDTYTGADMADEDGMFAKALGGKTSSDVKGLKDSNTYYGVQVGYDKAAANGWHTGVAFDYRNGDSNYLLGGKGDNQMYSLGVYGVKNFENDAFFRVAAKVGRVENEYDVYNEIRSLKLNGDYKANAYGLTMEYGKTFGDEEAYFTPKAQLTWSQVGAKDYTAHTDNATMQISQDSYSSFVGRLGFEAGVKSEKGRVYAGLFAAHEFNGDISASYFANDGDRKHTSFDGEETWMEMKLGGTYDFSNNAHLYADIAKDFSGNFERKWKMNVGLRFEF